MTHVIDSSHAPFPDDERFRRALRGSRPQSRSAAPPVFPADDESLRFRLTSLLLTMAVIAACLAIGRLLPAAGVLVSLIAAPAYIRTALASKQNSAQAPALIHCVWQLLVFCESLLVVAVLAGAGMGTLGGTIAAFFAGGMWLARIDAIPASGLVVACLFGGLALGVTFTFAVVGTLGQCLWPVRLRLGGQRFAAEKCR